MYIILSWGIALLSWLSPAMGVVVEVPPPRGNPDIAVTWPTRVQADEFTLFEFIKLINDYLRFAMGAIMLGVFIYGWVMMITAEGDSEKLSRSHRLLLGAGIGIIIVIFSYAVVRLIINLL